MKQVLSVMLALVLTFSIGRLSTKAVFAAEADGDVTITLLETTDIHGHMVEVGADLEDRSVNQYRLAYMSNQFKEYRKQGNVILLNGGDSFQGTPVSNFSYGKSIIKAFDAMQYDASVLGNHEFDWGLEAVLSENGTYIDSTIPVLASNLFFSDTKDRIPYTKDYTILERGGKKVAVIGWADEYSADIMAARIAPYTISEDVSIVNNLAKDLKDSKKADAVIVLAHADAAEAAELFDSAYVDFLFGGHSHKEENGVANSGIPYAEASSSAYGYSFATMTIKADGTVSVADTKFVSVYNKKDLSNLLNTEENAKNLDQEIVKICDASIDAVAPILNEKIATLPVALDRNMIDGSLSSVMGNWITDMLLYGQEDVDFAFCNDGGIRCNFDPKELTVYDIYLVSPFNNLMYKVQMKGSQVVKLLEQIIGNDSSNMQMSGLTAKYDLNREEDKQIFDVRLADGTPIDLTKTYTILTNEYIATGGNKYSVFLTDVLSSTNTKELDNDTILNSVRDLGKKGDLVIDAKPRLVEATMEVPVTEKNVTLYTKNQLHLVCDNVLGTAKVTYASSDKKVTKVDKHGVVTAKKPGEAVITTTVTQEGQTYTLETAVTVEKARVEFTTSAKKIKLGNSYQFRVKSVGVSGDVKWTSSNAKVATVSKNGKVISKKAGTTIITAKIGKCKISKEVTVTK